MKTNNNLIIYFSVSTGIGYGMLVVLSILSYSFSINIINEAKILISLLSIFFMFNRYVINITKILPKLSAHQKVNL